MPQKNRTSHLWGTNQHTGMNNFFLSAGEIPRQAEKMCLKFQLDSFQNHCENWDIFFAPHWVSHGNFALITATMATVLRYALCAIENKRTVPPCVCPPWWATECRSGLRSTLWMQAKDTCMPLCGKEPQAPCFFFFVAV